MTTYADSGRPSYAITVWADENYIYSELPVTGGPPYITKHALTENGLGKIISQMRELYRKDAHPVMLTNHPKLVGKASVATTQAQRQAALAVLRRLKII